MMRPVFYDIAVYPLERLVLSRWRRELIGQAEGKVLEVGAGTGGNLPYYQRASALVVTDYNEPMLRRGANRRRKPDGDVNFVVTDAQHLPFASGCFDSVIATLAFCTIPQPGMAMREIKRVLRPGGQLLLLEHVRAGKAWAVAIQNQLTPCWSRLADGCHLNRNTLELAQNNGFIVVEKRVGLDGWLLSARLTPRSGA